MIAIVLVTTLSGAIRKWITTSGAVNNALLGLVLILPVLLLFYKDEHAELIEKKKYSVFYVYFFFLIVFALNPLNSTIYHGILGLIIHLSFFSILVSYFKNKAKLNTRLLILISTSLLVFEVVLGSIQYASSADSFINRYAVAEDVNTGVALVGDAIRVTGTFSYIAGFSTFLFLGLFTVFYALKTNIFKNYGYILLGLVIYGALISGSRGTVVFTVGTSIIFLAFEIRILTKLKVIVNIFLISIALLVINIGLGDPLNISTKFERSYDNFYTRAEGSQEDGQKRVFKDIDDILNSPFQYKVTGIGLGSTYQGANALFGESPLLSNITYEGELFRILIEGGFLLVILRIVLLIYFLSIMEFSLVFKVFLFFAINLLVPIVFNIYSSVFLGVALILLNQAYDEEKNLLET
ncbi:hypothetical protein I5M32_03735 [Pedobacter sp. SD-b]|uniref:O-Antigen ligase n=1 Tax=Pedobacter segetis TaxID=2793069 RepID=A0ABS1BI76_9SPHI|nr:hypothetical protein [Pedobacter segetis]MBK0382061.1 hypothetical protein [Pedobacter segetis]